MSDDLKLYAVLSLIEKADVNVSGHIFNLKLELAEGMVGAIPVFETEEAATAFAGDNYSVVSINAKEL